MQIRLQKFYFFIILHILSKMNIWFVRFRNNCFYVVAGLLLKPCSFFFFFYVNKLNLGTVGNSRNKIGNIKNKVRNKLFFFSLFKIIFKFICLHTFYVVEVFVVSKYFIKNIIFKIRGCFVGAVSTKKVGNTEYQIQLI